MRKFNYPEGEYFVKNSETISNIVAYDKGVLKPKRKI
jgi:hypothetical protein